MKINSTYTSQTPHKKSKPYFLESRNLGVLIDKSNNFQTTTVENLFLQYLPREKEKIKNRRTTVLSTVWNGFNMIKLIKIHA